MTNEEYHKAQGISSSKLKWLDESVVHLEKSNLFYHETDSMDLGTLVHTLVFEPNDFEKLYAAMPNIDGRTTYGKTLKKEFIEDNEGKIIVTGDDYERASLMARNVIEIAGGLIKQGIKEQSYFVEDDGLLIKCRPDNYIEKHGLIIDLKTISSKHVGGITDFDIKRQIKNLRYDRSAAFYLKVLRLLDLPASKFVFIFVDSAAPHMVKIRELEQHIIDNAMIEIDVMLGKYREYLRTKRANNVIKTIGELK